MGLDTHDGRGERAILSERRSYVKPMLTPRGDRIVFSSRVVPGPPEIFIVNFDGTGLRTLAPGFALALWENPADESEWVYVGTDNTNHDFATVTRFPLDAPDKREPVWKAELVSMDQFQVSADGRHAAGLFPWPHAGIADLRNGTVKRARRRVLGVADPCARAVALVLRRRASKRDDGGRGERQRGGW